MSDKLQTREQMLRSEERASANDKPLSRLVLAATQLQHDVIGVEIFRLALADFTPKLTNRGLERLALQLSKLDPIGL